MSRPRQIAVIGSGACEPGSELSLLAAEVGERLAQAGAVLVCGGLGGVMEAASRGAADAGGTVIGIVPWDSPERANPHCTHVVSTGIGEARNLAVVASGEVVIAVGGEWGTLSEIGHARKIGRTVVALRSWSLAGGEGMEPAPGERGTEEAPGAHGTEEAPGGHGVEEAPGVHGTEEAPGGHGVEEAPGVHGTEEAPGVVRVSSAEEAVAAALAAI